MQPLEVQLHALDAWHTWAVSSLRGFSRGFRSAGATVVAAADARAFSAGLESLHYEGPLAMDVS